MNFKRSKIIILFDSPNDNASNTFQKNWENEKDETEIVTLTATKDNLVSLENENMLTSLRNVVYVGDNLDIRERINIDGGTTFSTTEFINLTNNILKACSASDTGQNDLANSLSVRFKNPRTMVHKIKKLNKIGLYLKKQKTYE